MRLRHVGLLAALGTVAAFAACTLNPQPLPPRDDLNGESTSNDAGARSDAGGFGAGPENPGTADAGTATPSADSDGGSEAGDDGGDGGADDGGDASDADGG